MSSCGCGCGTPIPDLTKQGKPMRFVHGHNGRVNDPGHVEEDRGHDTPCWIWQGGTDTRGIYGRRRYRGKTMPAHRVAYELANDCVVPDDLDMDHLCRQTLCVNPAHVEPVTRAENIRRCSSTKLSAAAAGEIRKLAADELAARRAAGKKRRSDGWEQTIADRFGVSRGAVHNVVHDVNWRAA